MGWTIAFYLTKHAMNVRHNLLQEAPPEREVLSGFAHSINRKHLRSKMCDGIDAWVASRSSAIRYATTVTVALDGHFLKTVVNVKIMKISR